MAEPQKFAPGPVGTSCLTCKRRHKKCDLRRPTCERCEKGGYDCLGYSHNKQERGAPSQLLASSRQSLRPSPQGKTNVPVLGVEHEDAVSSFPSSYWSTCVSPEPSQEDQLIITQRNNDHNIYPSSEIPAVLDCQSRSAAHPPVNRVVDPIQPVKTSLAFSNQIPYAPYHLSKTLLDSSNLEDYVIKYCERMVKLAYFKPVQTQVVLLRGLIVSQLRASSFTRWVMFLYAKIIESFIKGDSSQNETFNIWINQIEQVLQAILAKNLPSGATHDRMKDWFLTVILKTMITQSSNRYQVLRNMTPTFLQIVFSDPTLWPNDCDLTSVPLASVIASPRHELTHFVLMDITAAMAFGLPQQVEYNTSLNGCSQASLPDEYAHGSPIEFQIALAEINACRDKSVNARSWEEIEYKLTTWQSSSSGYDPGWESWMMVAWFAVQESWRHTLLAYLYMSVCDASSDDPRVQRSVRQILRVVGTVKKHESSGANVPFFIQYLMAGICARNERHRSTAREHLANVSETRLWLMRAVDFVPVLDDLWHGAAANGRPVKWPDYVRSRERALPVVL